MRLCRQKPLKSPIILYMKRLPIKIIGFETPRRVFLQGLQLGADKPSRVYIFIHGLGGSIFSRIDLLSRLADKSSAVITFNNRGSGLINGFKRRRGNKYQYAGLGGLAHEVFSDCVDDISGAVDYALNLGVRDVFLIGHSTGCQKSVYYLAKKKNSPVKGAVLLAPVSDYAALQKEVEPVVYRRALKEAKKLVAAGRSHALLPAEAWRHPIDAQRFLSLYTPESREEIFGYASRRRPDLLKKVQSPLYIFLAEEDEYHDRPTQEIAAWFKDALFGRSAGLAVINDVGHDFSPAEGKISRMIKSWSKRCTGKGPGHFKRRLD